MITSMLPNIADKMMVPRMIILSTMMTMSNQSSGWLPNDDWSPSKVLDDRSEETAKDETVVKALLSRYCELELILAAEEAPATTDA